MIKLKQGATREADDLIFWRYIKSAKNGEWWISAERFSKMKESSAIARRKYRANNREKENERTRKWRAENPEASKKSADKSYHNNKDERNRKHAKWCKANKAHINAYNKNKALTDPIFRIKRNLRASMKQALRAHLEAKAESAATCKYLGCTIPELITHLESKFKTDMTWDNYGREGWHIDHRKPLAMFDLSKKSQQMKACHYTNLQPLWAKENSAKGARWIG